MYDSANQLIRENNQSGGFTHTWEYDNSGNILNRKEYGYTTGALGTPTYTANYAYGIETDPDDDWGYIGETWGDILYNYDDLDISVDGIGNIVYDIWWEYTWEHGRELASMFDGLEDWNFTYDAGGMRVRRSFGDTVYQYVYNGSQLSQMTVGTNTLRFAYDADGTPVSVIYNGTTYYYETNLQGDVVAIRNSSGAVVVAYTYDAWGYILSTTGSLKNSLGHYNPLRYRGYVYDTETGLYYLQSRYYNPEIGRFINADVLISTGQGLLGNNMFAYCNNNPVSMIDRNGKDAIYVVDYGFVYGLPVFGHARVYLQDEAGDWFVTEFTGEKKTDAKVYVYPADTDEVQRFLNGQIVSDQEYVVIKGDFSNSKNLASLYKDTDYGGYNFLANNCNHYAKEILSAGQFKDSFVGFFVKNTPGMIPSTYGNVVDTAVGLSDFWKEVKKCAKSVWDSISEIFK